jgi:L-alanine-DL-glutamate epimerase-like enolase superfamily enzyme
MIDRINALEIEYLPLALRNPFVLSIRTATHANIFRWTLKTESGKIYLGESVPVQYVTGETVDSVRESAVEFKKILLGRDVGELGKILGELEQKYPKAVSARAGIEIIHANLLASESGVDLSICFGGALQSVVTDLTITKTTSALQIARLAWREGFRIFKMKVGGEDVVGDLERLINISNELTGVRFRLDANQAFTASEALRFIEAGLNRGLHIELIEQPVPKEDLNALDEVARQSPIPVIADEACVNAQDAVRLFTETAVHGVNVKIMKSGIAGTLEIIKLAKAANRKLMIGCMLESHVGIAASVALACGTGAFEYVDLDAHKLVIDPEGEHGYRSEGALLLSN